MEALVWPIVMLSTTKDISIKFVRSSIILRVECLKNKNTVLGDMHVAASLFLFHPFLF